MHGSTGEKELLDMMLKSKDPKSGQSMTERMIVDNVLTFLFAGQESTSAAMASCMCFLDANLQCKTRLLQEIDQVVGSSELEWDHLSKLQYLDWCIKETLRLVPPAPSVVRVANGNQVIGNKWHIPDGCMVVINIMALHYNEKLWGIDANKFKPERWENAPAHGYAYLPCASGPRECIGREFALAKLKVTLVKLFQHFHFRRPDFVRAAKGYTTLRKESQTQVPLIGMDVEFKDFSAIVGLYSAFELQERSPTSDG